MTVRAAVALTKRVPAGVGVSYGHTYFPDRETTLALVPVGYADGVPRAAGNRAPVLAGGEQRTIAGRVCMDQFVLDVGDAAGRAGRRGRPVGDGGARRADGAAVGRRRRHHPLRAGHPGRRPLRPPLRRLGGGGLMARNPEAERRRTRAGTPRASSVRVIGLAAAGTAAGVAVSRVAARRVRAAELGGKQLADARLREDDPLGGASRAADRTALVQADDGVLLSVEEIGPRDAPLTVVFVHGYTLSMASWAFQRRTLAAELATANGHRPDARLVFYDQRGHGASAAGARPSGRRSSSWRGTWPPSSRRGCRRGRWSWSGTRWAA